MSDARPTKALTSDGSEAGEWPVGVGNIDSYREPWVDLAPDAKSPVQHVWADLAKAPRAVAPADPGQESKNENKLRERAREFLFLDVGRWLKDSRDQARDFGLIWGRHAYLCRFQRTGFADPPRYSRPGLDRDFLVGMGNTCRPVTYASATWADEGDFDWDHVYVIVPDMHLMARQQALVWYGADACYMQPERDFFEFARRLVASGMAGKMKFIQIGDSFDLWVDCRPPQFIPDEKARRVELRSSAITDVPKWVFRIQGMDADGTPGVGTNWVFDQLKEKISPQELDALPDPLRHLIANRANEFSTPEWQQYVVAGPRVWRNPVDAAFRMLEARLGSDVIYIYGNHDDYLAHADICEAAGLRPRRPFEEFPGVYIEHGHRMEIPEVVSHPIGGYNSDGLCEDAWKSTNTVYDHMANNEWTFTGWAESNIRLPERFLPLFAASWLKTFALFLALVPFEALAGGIKWIAGKLTFSGDLGFNLPADISFSQWFDQPWYIQEYANVWVGRYVDATKLRLPPHIFVIGHTHLPLLAHLRIFRDTPERRRRST